MLNHHQIFNDRFEPSWKEFDDLFRQKLLEKFRTLGSIHRLSCSHEEANTEFGRLFYEALEHAIGESRLIHKLKAALVIEMPKNFDELDAIFKLHSIYPLHAFFLLVLYVHEHPMRAFFSGRDRALPLNTLTLQFHQGLSDPLPTGVDYELDYLTDDRWMRLADEHGATADLQSGGGGRPQHYWTDLRWVWHFDVGGGQRLP
jgi:hypothetical protein